MEINLKKGNIKINKIYLKMSFSFNQLANATVVHKDLPSYKARALIYQSILLSNDVEQKINGVIRYLPLGQDKIIEHGPEKA